MQLFAGELTNQNREYYKVNDNNRYAANLIMKAVSFFTRPVLWASTVLGEQHCQVIPERLVASQEFFRKIP